MASIAKIRNQYGFARQIDRVVSKILGHFKICFIVISSNICVFCACFNRRFPNFVYGVPLISPAKVINFIYTY